MWFSILSGAIWGYLKRALDLVARYPWQAALCASLALSWWMWGGKQDALSKLEACKTARKNDRAEWDRKVAAAKAATAKAEKDGKDAAQSAQETVNALRSDNAGLRAHIARNRLRQEGSPANPARPGEDHGSAVPDDPAPETLVATTVADLRVCDENYAYAQAAYEFTRDLIERDLAIPSPEFGK